MRARTNISTKERRQLTLSGFRGVDLSSAPIDVAPYRASYMRNFINENGVNHKRPGWREVARPGVRINGIFEFSTAREKKTIFQSGDIFCELKGEYDWKSIDTSGIDMTLIDPEARSQGFMLNDALYIIGCGDFLVYKYFESTGKYELRRVFDMEGAYIPTTTIGMLGRYYDEANAKWVDSTGAETLDDVNLLCTKRRNKFIGHATDSATEKVVSVKYQLDEAVKPKTIVEIVAENGNSNAGGEITAFGQLYYAEWNYPALRGVTGNTLIKTTREAGTYTIRNSADDFYSLHEYAEDGTRGAKVGCIADDGEIYLYSLYDPPIEMESNITVTFTPDDEEGIKARSEMITKCRFGTRFGTDNRADRLFLSGNPSYPNVDFHSEENDYTYFGELNTAALGDVSSAVAGYARLSDSSLVIYKEESNSEPAFFFRTGKYLDKYDENGNIEYMRGVFPHTEGGVGEGVISRHAHANLCGDTLFLSRGGVHGLVLSENMLTTERYARERSKNIRGGLASHEDLSEAVGIVYKNRYYLAVDGICYVADPRHKFSSSDDIDGSFNYEWWIWDNIPARVWGKIGDDLYFGTEDGAICVFDGEFSDRTYVFSKPGDISIDTAEGNVIYNVTSEDLSVLREGDKIDLFASLYAIADENMTVEGGRIYTSEENMQSIFNEMEVYTDGTVPAGIDPDTLYFVADINRGNNSYRLINRETFDYAAPENGDFTLYKKVRGWLYLAEDANPDDGRFFLKEKPEGCPIRLSRYHEVPTLVITRIEYARPVVAEWITPVFDLGTNVYSKTLTGMTISAQATKGGNLRFGYETRVSRRELIASGCNTFSLADFSFKDFTFDTGFQSSYSVRLCERDFNYIAFHFVSDSAADCVINDFTVNYKINKANKGVR